MMKRLRFVLWILPFLLVTGGCSEESPTDLLTGNPGDVTLIAPGDAYLHLKMDGGPLMFTQLKFKPIADSNSTSFAVVNGDTINVTYRRFIDMENNLELTTTTPFHIRNSGVGSANVMMEGDNWGAMEVKPINGTTEYDFVSLRLEMYNSKNTVSLKSFGTIENAKVEVTSPVNIRAYVGRMVDPQTFEETEIPSIGSTLEMVTLYGE